MAALTIAEIIRHNLREARSRGRWVGGRSPDGKWVPESRRQVADRIKAWTGDPTWDEWQMYDIEGRKGRNRAISPEELGVLAVTYDTTILDLMTPPADVKVKVGSDELSPPVFGHVLGRSDDGPSLEDELMRRLVAQHDFKGAVTVEALTAVGVATWIAEAIVRHYEWLSTQGPIRSRTLVRRALSSEEWRDQLNQYEIDAVEQAETETEGGNE